MHYANRDLFFMISTLLWAANIRPPLDKDGNAILPSTLEFVGKGIKVYVSPADS